MCQNLHSTHMHGFSQMKIRTYAYIRMCGIHASAKIWTFYLKALATSTNSMHVVHVLHAVMLMVRISVKLTYEYTDVWMSLNLTKQYYQVAYLMCSNFFFFHPADPRGIT